MATEIATAYVSLVPSFRGGSRAISGSLAGPIGKAGPAAGRSLGRSILGGVARAAAIGGGIVAALGIKNLGSAALSAASGLQDTSATLAGLLGSAEDARDTIQRLRDVARDSPISASAYLDAGEALAYMGYSGAEAAGILENVGAAITAAGGDDEAIGRATAAMLKMVNSGKVYAAQLNQISDTGIPIFSALASHFNTNIANVREMVSAGEVGINDVMTAIKNAEGDTFQAMIAASQGASQTLSNQWKIAKDNIIQALADELMPVIEGLTPAMQKFAQVAPPIFAAIAKGIVAALTGAVAVVQRLGSASISMAQKLTPYWDALFGRGDEYSSSPIIRGLLRVSELLQGVRREFNQMPRTIWFGEIRNNVLDSLERAKGLVGDIRREVNQFPRTNEFARLMDRVESLKTDTLSRFSSIWESLKRTFLGVLPSVERIGSAIGVLVPVLVRASAEVGVSVWQIFLAVLDALAKTVEAVLVPAMDILSRALMSVAEWLEENRGAARALVAVYTAWKVGGLVVSLGRLAAAVVTGTVALVKNTAATVANAAAKARSAVQTGILVGLYARDAVVKAASTTATLAQTVATKAAALAQRGLNLAMRANPIGLIITLLGALVAGLVYAWKNSETFRNIVTAVWNAIRAAAQFAWSRVIKPIFSAYVTYLKTLWNVAVTAKDIIVAAWNAIRAGLGAAWSWIKTNVIDRAIASFQWVWDKAVDIKNGVVGAWGLLRDGLGAAWRWIRDNAIDPLRAGFQRIWDKAVEVKDGIVAAFESVAGSIAGVFENVTGAIKGALNTVFGWINRNMIRNINKVTSAFDLEIPELPKLHSGGHVPGRGERPYMLLGGESVLNPKATKFIGKDTVDALNNGTYKHRRGENDPFAMGGWPDWASWDSIKQGLALGFDTTRGATALEGGLLKAIEGVHAAVTKGIGAVIPGPEFVEKPVVGQVKKFMDAVLDWAKDGEESIAVPDDFGGGFGGSAPTFNGRFAFPLPRGSYRVGGGIGSYPGHTGRDFPAPTGTPVFSPMAGRVNFVRMAGSYGLHANVYAGALRFIAAHLSAFAGSNRMVKAGERIGSVGSTGNSTGPHLHAEFRRNGAVVSPDQYIGLDSGMGVLKPGHNLVYNGTGADEPVVDPRRYGGGVTINTYGTPRQLISDMEFAMRKREMTTRMVGV